MIAGAFVASAFSLALVALGAGIGLVSVSPWSSNNPSITTFTVLAAAWFIAVENSSHRARGVISQGDYEPVGRASTPMRFSSATVRTDFWFGRSER